MPSPTSLAPGYVRVTYDGVLFPHHMTIPVNFSGTPTPGVMPDLILKDASTDDVESAIGALIAVILPFYTSAIHFGLAEAHTVDATTGEDQFIWSWNLNAVGSTTGSQVATEQLVFVFKTSVGSLYKLYLMESVIPANEKQLPPFVDAAFSTLSDFVVGDTSPCYGRQNAYPFTPISWLSKYNDKLRKQQGLA